MKTSLFCSGVLFSLGTSAFPASVLKNDISAEQLAEITALTERITREATTKIRLEARDGYDADAQKLALVVTTHL